MSRSLKVQPKYIQDVKLAWWLKSNGREQELAQELGRSLLIVIINLFLKGKPVNRLNFIEICNILGLDWRLIAGLEDRENPPASSGKATGELEQRDSLSSVSFEERQCLAESSLQTIRKLYPPIPVNSSNAIEPSRLEIGVNAIEEALDELVGTLCQMLRRLTRKAGDLLCADRTSIFLIDRERQALGSLIADDGAGGSLIIEIPLGKGIAGLAATSLRVINIPFDLYDDPRSEQAKNVDNKTGYRTYSTLACPLLNKQKDVVAVVQLINKVKPNHNPEDDLLTRIDEHGFTQEDEVLLAKFMPSILKILERCQTCYQLIQNLRKNPERDRAGFYVQNAKLLAQLKQEEQKLRKSLARI